MTEETLNLQSCGEAIAGRSEDGVDLTLIRWMLSLTPAQRLDVLQEHVRTILRMRDETSGT